MFGYDVDDKSVAYHSQQESEQHGDGEDPLCWVAVFEVSGIVRTCR